MAGGAASLCIMDVLELVVMLNQLLSVLEPNSYPYCFSAVCDVCL